MNEQDAIMWTDPPTPNAGGRKRFWEGHLAPLRERPGAWAIVRRYDSPQRAHQHRLNLAMGRIAGVDPAEWEFTARTSDEGGVLYARFIGGES